MDEKNILKLRVLERTEQMLDNIVEEQVKSDFSNKILKSGQTNPIYKKMLEFHNSKIGDKFSVRDLLR